MTFSSLTYLPSNRAKLPYALGWVADFRKTPSGAIDLPSEPKLIQGMAISFLRLSSDMEKNTADTLLPSSMMRSMMVSSGDVPLMAAISATVFPCRYFSESLSNPMTIIFSGVPCFLSIVFIISGPITFRTFGSRSLATHLSNPPSCTHSGMMIPSPVPLAG